MNLAYFRKGSRDSPEVRHEMAEIEAVSEKSTRLAKALVYGKRSSGRETSFGLS